jgi:DNA-binding winged helix-turn-helix (wHTH) protein/tetratricopeptide (TPR) repeat protein
MHAIVLAHEKSFRIGPVDVRPSTRTIAREDKEEILEPRVMQVLVALAQERGAVVSRDDLVEACWNGRVVGDDAINRVIGRLRRTAEGIGADVFSIDTITRVGYRLRLLSDGAAFEPPRPRTGQPKGRAHLSRRELVIGGAVGAAAVTGGGAWWLWNEQQVGPDISEATASLIEQARFALAQDTREGQNQAIGLFRRVVADHPDYADAWGFLGVTYALTAHYRQSSEAEVLRGRAISAAQRAVALDPDNSLGRAGLALARPVVGNWSAIDSGLRQAVEVKPQTYEVTLSLAHFLGSAGLSREALYYLTLISPAQPIPSNYYNRALLLWAVGRFEDLDNLLSEAARIFPTHYAIWFTRFYVSMLSGRPEEALALAADTTNRPTNIDPEEIESVVRVARAIQSRSPDQVESVSREWVAKAHAGAGYAENAAQFLVALGRFDEVFAILRGYFFSEGFDCGELRFSNSQGAYTPRNDRLTAWLFNPAMAPVRADPRFAKVLSGLGFPRFWKDSGRPPDFLARG